MKKHLSLFKARTGVTALMIIALLMFSACGTQTGTNTNGAQTSGDTGNSSDMMTLKVGASTTPHAEILNALKDTLAKEGVDMQVIEYTDYVTPNTAVENGELDANYFQHLPYLEDFNTEKGTDLVSVLAVHYEPLGIFPGKSKDLKNISDGAKIAVPNDTTNEARALKLLEAQGLIKLPADAGFEVTPKDIVENPHNLEFLEVEAAAVARSLQDVDFGVINGNYALSAGLTAEDGLVFEASDSDAAQTYANIIAVKAGNENNEAIQKLVKVLTSEECRTFIEDKYNGMVLPVF